VIKLYNCGHGTTTPKGYDTPVVVFCRETLTCREIVFFPKGILFKDNMIDGII
jgi:hypothetical protein